MPEGKEIHGGSIKTIVDHWVLITVIVLFFGYLHLHSFYSLFHIEIYHYLDASEILMSILPIAATGSILAAFMFAPLVVWRIYAQIMLKKAIAKGREARVLHEKQGDKTKASALQEKTFQVLAPPKILLVLIGVHLVFGPWSFATGLPEYWADASKVDSLIVGCSSVAALLTLIHMAYLQSSEAPALTILLQTGLWLLAFGIIVALHGHGRAQKIRLHAPTQLVCIQFTESKIDGMCGYDPLRYVGQTKSHIFFWHSEGHYVESYQTSTIARQFTIGLSEEMRERMPELWQQWTVKRPKH